jgi:hypothetical protein
VFLLPPTDYTAAKYRTNYRKPNAATTNNMEQHMNQKDREAIQLKLDELEKLAEETPTTHVRAGKANFDGKEIVALWFDDCSDPIQQAIYINETKPEKLKEFLKQVRDRLAQPEREWVGLTDEEVIACWSDGFNACEQKTVADLRNFIARAIELKFKEKNV